MEAKELLEVLTEERDFCKKMLNSKGYIVKFEFEATAHYNSYKDVVIAHTASKAKVMSKADAESMLKEPFTTTRKGVRVAVIPELEIASQWFKKRYEDYKRIIELVQDKNNN
jgi:hypothetical protein